MDGNALYPYIWIKPDQTVETMVLRWYVLVTQDETDWESYLDSEVINSVLDTWFSTASQEICLLLRWHISRCDKTIMLCMYASLLFGRYRMTQAPQSNGCGILANMSLVEDPFHNTCFSYPLCHQTQSRDSTVKAGQIWVIPGVTQRWLLRWLLGDTGVR